jgi:AraC-like DNA-binding protein
MYQLDSRKYWSDANVPVQFEFRNPQSPFPLHIHDFHELVLVYSGKATHLTINGDYDVQSGDFINNYRSQLNMNILTGISGMSESHVLRSFKQYLGCSPFQYINRLRLSAATDALIQTDKSITEIALDLGFNDSNYFTRSFRKHSGLSPREYRYRYLKENLL